MSSSYWILLKDFLQQLSKAFNGQGMNQSKIQQLINAGNFLILTRKFSPTGDVQNTICKLDLVFSTNKSYVKSGEGCKLPKGKAYSVSNKPGISPLLKKLLIFSKMKLCPTLLSLSNKTTGK